MRPTLLAGPFGAVRHNLNHGIRDVSLYEIGRIFASSASGQATGELPNERDALALIAHGGAIDEGHAQARREIDFFDLKGALKAAIDAMNLGPLAFENV